MKIPLELICALFHLIPVAEMPRSFRGDRRHIVTIFIPIHVRTIPCLEDGLNLFPLRERRQTTKLSHHRLAPVLSRLTAVHVHELVKLSSIRLQRIVPLLELFVPGFFNLHLQIVLGVHQHASRRFG